MQRAGIRCLCDIICNIASGAGCRTYIFYAYQGGDPGLSYSADQAQYRELEAFSKFSSDMDPVTAMAIDRGRKNNQLLIQPQYTPMPVGEQVAILYCGTHSLMREVPIEKVRAFQDAFLTTMRANYQKDVLDVLAAGKISDEVTAIIEKVAADTVGQFKEK